MRHPLRAAFALLLATASCFHAKSEDLAIEISEYHAHQGVVFDTFAITSMGGVPVDWSNPATDDWPTSSIVGDSRIRGHNWQIWKDAILARNPALTVATLASPNPTWAEYVGSDIVMWTDAAGDPRIAYHREAMEHYLSMHKWVVLQHAPPPKTLERIRARSRVGTRFGTWSFFDAVSFTRAYTHVIRPAQEALLPHYLHGTRADANGKLHVDVMGATPDANVPDVAAGQMTDTAIPGRWWYVDVQKPQAAIDEWAAIEALDAIYGGTMDFYWWDSVNFNPYFGQSQFYNASPYANAPWTATGPVPNPPPSGAPVNNPDPMTAEGYRGGWVRLFDLHIAGMTARYGGGVGNLRRTTWGNSGFPPAPDYAPDKLGVCYHEHSFGNAGLSQPLPTLAALEQLIDQSAAENRPLVLAQITPSNKAQAVWMKTAGPGFPNGTWAELVEHARAVGAPVYVQTSRDWSFWEPGFLPPEGL